ncbi:hypothetical protein IAQ61_005011 [Plenodomus lingam]|nr:hypothetical protein IAQ61_005011 [Plenodomus lingam]
MPPASSSKNTSFTPRRIEVKGVWTGERINEVRRHTSVRAVKKTLERAGRHCKKAMKAAAREATE